MEICLPTVSKAASLLTRLMSHAFVDEYTRLLAGKTKPAEDTCIDSMSGGVVPPDQISKLFPVSHDIFEADQHTLGNFALLKSRSLAWG
jgi:hypothetical protein